MSKKIDILFIKPGDHKQIYQALGNEFAGIEPPAFAGLFATYSRKKGLEVGIYDVPAMQVSAEKAAEAAVTDFDPLLVAITVYGLQPSASTQDMESAGKIARLIKERRPDVKIIMTGTHPASLPELTMRQENVDFVCDKEGPATIYKTAVALKEGKTDFSDIPSLWWRKGAEIVKPLSAEPLLDDLDNDMPGPAWDLLPMEKYRAHNWHCFGHINERSPYASMYTSLGCPYKCSFCCINAPFGKNVYRMWSPETIVGQIDILVEKYGVKNIKFVDEMFVLNKSHVFGICDLLIKRDYKVNIWAYARVDTVQENMLDKLKAAGFNWLCLGIESGSANVRDTSLKNFKNKDITQVVRRIQEAGINVLGNYIFGLPDDTHESMQATLDLALDLNCEFANFYCAMAYPGSPLYAQAVAKGLELPESWSGYSQHAYHTRPLANANLTSAEILAFRDKAFTTYFTHQPYLDMVKQKFGQDVVEHINRMVAVPLKRKLLEERLAS